MESGKRWAASEIEILKDRDKSILDIKKILTHRSVISIGVKARRLGYKRQGDSRLRISKNYKELLLDKEFCSIVDGELLGDGCITKRKSGHCSFTYSTRNHEYAEFLCNYLNYKTTSSSKVFSNYKHREHYIGNKLCVTKESHGINITHKVFTFFYDRWYKYGIKIVPKNLYMTPLICLHWFIGDGKIDNGRTAVIGLATHGFTFQEVNQLVGLLNDINIESHIGKEMDKYTVLITGRHALNFLKYIGNCPVQSYKYKWDVGKYKEINKICFCGNKFLYYGTSEKWKRYCSKDCYIRAKLDRCIDVKKNKYKNLRQTVNLDLNSRLDCYRFGLLLNLSNEIYPQSYRLITANLLLKNHFPPIFDLTDIISEIKSVTEGDLSNIRYIGDFLRGLFDASGTINKTSENFFLIQFRSKYKNLLLSISTITSGNISQMGNKLCIRKRERHKVFNLMYSDIDKEPFLKKKMVLFHESISRRRTFNRRDHNGRFIRKNRGVAISHQ